MPKLLKTLFIVSMSMSLLLAEDKTFTFFVENSTMLDVYNNIFNLYAALMGSKSYIDLLKLTFLIGGAATFAFAVGKTLNQRNSSSFKMFPAYILTVTILLIIFMGQTASVVLHNKDENIYYCPTFYKEHGATVTNDAKIDNVPMIIAFLASATNQIESTLSDMAKTSFSNRAGKAAVSASKVSASMDSIVGAKKILQFSPEKLQIDMKIGNEVKKVPVSQIYTALLSQCVVIPASADATYGDMVISVFEKTGNPNQTLINYITQNRLSMFKNPTAPEEVVATNLSIGGSLPENKLIEFYGSTYTCGDLGNAYKDAVKNLLSGDDIVCDKDLQGYMTDNAIQMIMGGGEIMPNKAIASQIAFNAGLSALTAKEANKISAGELDYTAAYNTAEQALSRYAEGVYMMEVMPYIQMALRAVLYAFFPFLFIVMILPGGLKILGEYLRSLVWIELWSPIMIVLGMFVSMESMKNFGQVYNESGFNPINSLYAFSDTVTIAGVAGYLFAFVPGIAWLALRGGMALIGNFGWGLSASIQSKLIGEKENVDLAYISLMNSGDVSSLEKHIAKSTLAQRSIVQKEILKQLGDKVSLSQYQLQQSLFKGAERAGEFTAYQEMGEESLRKSAKGNEILNVAEGMGIERALQIASNVDSLASKQEVDISSEVKVGKSLSSSNVEEISRNIATSAFGDMKAQSQYMEMMHHDIKTIAHAKAYQEAVKTPRSINMSQLVGVKMHSSIEASKKIMEIKEIDGMLRTVQDLTNKNISDAGKAFGEYVGAQTAAAISLVNNIGAEDIEHSKEISLYVEYGQSAAIPEVQRKQMIGFGKRFTGGSDSLSIYKREKEIAPIGETKKVFYGYVGDRTAVQKQHAGISSSKDADIIVSQYTKKTGELQEMENIRGDEASIFHNESALYEMAELSGEIKGTTIGVRDAAKASSYITLDRDLSNSTLGEMERNAGMNSGISRHADNVMIVQEFQNVPKYLLTYEALIKNGDLSTALYTLGIAALKKDFKDLLSALWNVTDGIIGNKRIPPVLDKNSPKKRKKRVSDDIFRKIKKHTKIKPRHIRKWGARTIKLLRVTGLFAIASGLYSAYEQNEEVVDKIMNEVIIPQAKNMYKELDNIEGIKNKAKYIQQKTKEISDQINRKYGYEAGVAITKAESEIIDGAAFGASVSALAGSTAGAIAAPSLLLMAKINDNMGKAWSERELRGQIVREINREIARFNAELVQSGKGVFVFPTGSFAIEYNPENNNAPWIAHFNSGEFSVELDHQSGARLFDMIMRQTKESTQSLSDVSKFTDLFEELKDIGEEAVEKINDGFDKNMISSDAKDKLEALIKEQNEEYFWQKLF